MTRSEFNRYLLLSRGNLFKKLSQKILTHDTIHKGGSRGNTMQLLFIALHVCSVCSRFFPFLIENGNENEKKSTFKLEFDLVQDFPTRNKVEFVLSIKEI